MLAIKKENNHFCSPPCYVDPTGEVSNFIIEDFEAVLKFMNAEVQKKKRKL
jgi:hypothetical protein